MPCLAQAACSHASGEEAMKIKEIREETTEELSKRLDELRQEIFQIRFQAAVGKQTNPKRVGNLKKDLARILTVIRERESGEQP